MNIGILRPMVGVGGAEISATELAVNLENIGNSVWMGFDNGDSQNSIDFNKFGHLKDRLSTSSKKYFHENALNEEWMIENLSRTDLVIILHRNFFSQQLASAVNGVNRKIVYVPGKNEHHVRGYIPGDNGNGTIITNIEKFLFNSKYTYNLHLSKKYEQSLKDKFYYMYPPMDFEFYNKKFVDSNVASTSKFTILVIGRLIPSKRPELAVSVMNDIVNKYKYKNVQLKFLGDGPQADSVNECINKFSLSDYVKILGMKSDPFDYMKQSDCVLHLCDHESLSRSIREAMVFEKPIIAFDGAGNRELCASKSLLFKNDNDICNKIMLLIKNRQRIHLLQTESKNKIIKLEKEALDGLKKMVSG